MIIYYYNYLCIIIITYYFDSKSVEGHNSDPRRSCENQTLFYHIPLSLSTPSILYCLFCVVALNFVVYYICVYYMYILYHVLYYIFYSILYSTDMILLLSDFNLYFTTVITIYL